MTPTKRQFARGALVVLWTCVGIVLLGWIWQAAQVLTHPPVRWAGLVPSLSTLPLPLLAVMLTVQQRSRSNDPDLDQPFSRERWLLIVLALVLAVGAGIAAFFLSRHA